MVITEAITAVETAIGSMYTREDVISLLKKLEAPPAKGNVDVSALINVINDAIKDTADNLDNGIIDLGSATFELNYNEISLESVDFDTSEIARYMKADVEEAINNYFEDLATGKD